MYSSTTLLGYVTYELQRKEFSFGVFYKFGLVTIKFIDGKEFKNYHNIKCSEKLGESLSGNIESGNIILVLGESQTRKVEKDGSAYYYTDVVAKEIHIVPEKRRGPIRASERLDLDCPPPVFREIDEISN